MKKKKIGQILLEHKLITEDILKEALHYQSKSGIGVTQYLLTAKYIKEEDLAKCICAQFGFPYLPLEAYAIPQDIIRLIPQDLVQKYWLIPIDKIDNVITVVMADPADTDAIREVEEKTGYRIQPFVGLISDIIKAIENYYHITITPGAGKSDHGVAISLDDDRYDGSERRRSVRLNAKIDIHFPLQEQYRRSQTKNISFHGFLFQSEKVLPVGSYVVLQIDLPKEVSVSPISAVVKIVRVTQLSEHAFDIGVETVKIREEDARLVIQHARARQELPREFC
ncbi:MAG: PilZ domain-containing protein [Candidatus Omnitrophota bacterium]